MPYIWFNVAQNKQYKTCICYNAITKQERSVSATSASLRPRIEDRLGLTPDIDGNGEEEEEEEEAEDDLAQSESSDNSGTMDDTVITNRKNRDFEFGFMEDEVCQVNKLVASCRKVILPFYAKAELSDPCSLIRSYTVR